MLDAAAAPRGGALEDGGLLLAVRPLGAFRFRGSGVPRFCINALNLFFVALSVLHSKQIQLSC